MILKNSLNALYIVSVGSYVICRLLYPVNDFGIHTLGHKVFFACGKRTLHPTITVPFKIYGSAINPFWHNFFFYNLSIRFLIYLNYFKREKGWN